MTYIYIIIIYYYIYIYVWLLFVGFDFSVWTTCPTPHERNRTSWWLTCGPIAIRPKGPIVVRLKNMQWPVLSYTSKCFVTQFKKIGCFPLVFVHDYIFLYLQWPVTSWRSPPFSWRVWRDSPPPTRLKCRTCGDLLNSFSTSEHRATLTCQIFWSMARNTWNLYIVYLIYLKTNRKVNICLHVYIHDRNKRFES